MTVALQNLRGELLAPDNVDPLVVLLELRQLISLMIMLRLLQFQILQMFVLLPFFGSYVLVPYMVITRTI